MHCKLAVPRRFKLSLFSLILFLAISFILASGRLVPRIKVLLSHVAPSKLSSPSYTYSRPITTATMAPQRYQNPPQAPPTFTATPSSLVEETKKIVRAVSHRV